jgi:putative glutamine amidotransferase
MRSSSRLDGVLLTGTPSNVEPARYGQDPSAGEGPFDPDRDAHDARTGRGGDCGAAAVFGICRGFQEINVALGGTLRRDTSASDGELLRHHAPEGTWRSTRCSIIITRSIWSRVGCWHRPMARTSLDVNSVHYQGVGRTCGRAVRSRRARPTAWSRRISARPNGAPLLAVQWHPEWATDGNDQSQTYFRLLGQRLKGANCEPPRHSL